LAEFSATAHDAETSTDPPDKNSNGTHLKTRACFQLFLIVLLNLLGTSFNSLNFVLELLSLLNII